MVAATRKSSEVDLSLPAFSRASPLVKLVQTEKTGEFEYERYSFDSVVKGASSYCGRVFLPEADGTEPAANSAGRTVIYLIHGAIGGDYLPIQMNSFQDFPPELVELCRSRRVEFVIPSVDQGFLREDSIDNRKSMADYLIQEIFPLAEASFEEPVAGRYIAGYSTGGFGAFSFFLRHPALFDGVCAIMPVIFDVDIESDTSVKKYVTDSSADLELVLPGIGMIRADFTDGADFRKHHPIDLLAATSSEGLAGKKIHLACGDADELGLIYSTRDLNQKLRQKNIAHRYQEYPGVKHELRMVSIGLLDALPYILE